MNSADLNRQPLIYADGYSYTEIFQAPDLPGQPSGKQLIRVFHPSFCDEHDDNSGVDPDPAPPSEAVRVPGEVA